MIYDVALRHKRGGKVHVARSTSKGAAWSYCGELFQGTDSVLMRYVDHALVTCRACKEAELLERQSRPPGWWKDLPAPAPSARAARPEPAAAGPRRDTRKARKAARKLARRAARA